jgi:transcriptional antiterminator RfaH
VSDHGSPVDAAGAPLPVWLLVRTKPKQERAVVDALAARGIAGYCPRILEPRTHLRAPRGPVPLFPSYLFVHCVLAEKYAAVHYCSGAAGVVRFGDHIATVEESLIAALRGREGERGYVEIAPPRRGFARGGRARVVAGPLAGLEGVIERYMPGRDRVQLLLAVVRGVHQVEVDARHVRPT